ncbi:ADAMTS-like protein 5 [Nymphon striatum]|nr:ADAMTS-like protein 5 [Nymphon striatum]
MDKTDYAKQLQCSMYNGRKVFGKVVNQWMYKSGGFNPCELTCWAVPYSFQYSFGKLRDGTICSTKGNGVGTCKNGRCESLMMEENNGKRHEERNQVKPSNLKLMDRPNRAKQPTKWLKHPINKAEMQSQMNSVIDAYNIIIPTFKPSGKFQQFKAFESMKPSSNKTDLDESKSPKIEKSNNRNGKQKKKRKRRKKSKNKEKNGQKLKKLKPKPVKYSLRQDGRHSHVTFIATVCPGAKELGRYGFGRAVNRANLPSYCQRCEKITDAKKNYCDSDFVLRVKVIRSSAVGAEARYEVHVIRTYKSSVPILTKEYIWAPTLCKCPNLRPGREHIVMGKVDESLNGRETRLVVYHNNYARRYNVNSAMRILKIRSKQHEFCKKGNKRG